VRVRAAQVGLAAGFALATTLVAGCGGSDPARTTVPRGATLVTISDGPTGRPIPPGFVGLSLEYSAVRAYTGHDPRAINPVFVQLIRNLAPGQSPVLRIGGDSTDSTWWPVPRMSRPLGISNDLSPGWLAATRVLAQQLGARLILGINLKADSPAIAGAEASAFLNGIGRRYIEALEIGNEPEVYGRLTWYIAPDGRRVYARPWAYGLPQYIAELSRIRAALPPAPLAAPATGFRDQLPYLGQLLQADPGLGLVTFHRYPLNRCFTAPSSRQYPTLSNLLSPFASRGLMWGAPRYIALAHAHGVPFRVDEMNSIACGGQRGLSDTFASALWAIDTLFEMARSGVDGVNFHTFPGARYSLFQFARGGRAQAFVHPEYYALLAFAHAAPAGSRLVPAAVRGPASVRAWATDGPGAVRHVVLINDGAGPRRVLVRMPASTAGATLALLKAPNVLATAGITLGGQTFGPSTTTGLLTGPLRTTQLAPAAGTYAVRLPAASAAIVTFSR
jgi:hypothetical protein